MIANCLHYLESIWFASITVTKIIGFMLFDDFTIWSHSKNTPQLCSPISSIIFYGSISGMIWSIRHSYSSNSFGFWSDVIIGIIYILFLFFILSRSGHKLKKILKRAMDDWYLCFEKMIRWSTNYQMTCSLFEGISYFL